MCDEPSGACVDGSQIVYVAVGGFGTVCTQTQPCGSISAGVAAASSTRRTLLVEAGEYTDGVVIQDKTLRLVATGVTLRPSTTNQVPLRIEGASVVDVEGLRITETFGTGDPETIGCVGTVGAPAELTLRGVLIEGNGGAGVYGYRCSVTMRNAIIFDNFGAGVQLSSSNLDIDRSRIIVNRDGGIIASGGVVTVRNTFIIKNGAGASSVGGVGLSVPESLTFEFNTVADNGATGGAVGIQCNAAVPQMLSSNIIVGTVPDQVSAANCSFAYTLSNESLPGTGNLTTPPTFVDAATNDYHLAAGSAGINAADPAATLSTDIDGQARPRGGRADIGADEAQ